MRGLIICGVRGIRKGVRYRQWHFTLLPTYTNHIRTIEHREPTSQILHVEAIDAAAGDLLVDLVIPMALELSLAGSCESSSIWA